MLLKHTVPLLNIMNNCLSWHEVTGHGCYGFWNRSKIMLDIVLLQVGVLLLVFYKNGPFALAINQDLRLRLH